MLRILSPYSGIGTKFNWASVWQLLLLLVAPIVAQAQNCDSHSPGFIGFTVGKNQACVDEPISIMNAPSTYGGIVNYYYLYDGLDLTKTKSIATPLQTGVNSTSTKYSSPGTYTILQAVSSGGTGSAYCQVVEIVETPTVSFSVTSCGNRTANALVKLDAQTSKYDSFSVSWGDGTSETKSRADVQAGAFSHAYGGQLTYFIVAIQGIYANGGCPGKVSNQPVTVSGGGRPAVTALTTNSDGTISIKYQGATDVIDLQQKDASGAYTSTGQTGTSGNFTIKTDTRQVQCFRLATASTCGTAQVSEEVCSLVLNGQAVSQQNNLTWNAYAGTTPIFTQYQLSRNGNALFSSPDKSVTSASDKTNIQCGTQYCYTLTATLQGQATTTITSAPVCVTGINPTSSGNAQKPAVTALRTNSDGTISINYQSNDPVQLQLKDASGVYKPISATITNGFITVSVDTKQIQCFKLSTNSPCGTPQESEEVCSMILTAKAASKQNDLSWQTYTGTAPTFTRYRVYRSGTPLSSINTKSTTTYSDADNIECGIEYCYYLETTVRGQTETIITSAPICVTGVNSTAPPTLQSVFVTIENGEVRVQGIAPTSTGTNQFTATITRAEGGSNAFQPIGTVTNSLLFIDSNVNTNQQSYCYQMTYQSSCGLASLPSPAVCTVWLASKGANGIDWTASSPFTPGTVANYILETVDTENNTTTFLDLAGNTHFDPDLNDPKVQQYRYRIVAYDANGTPSYSNYYEFRKEAKLYVPDAFTPNGDGANDTFAVRGVFVDQFSMTVYNRWGDAIFHTTEATTPWDGTINGQPAPAGSYAYRLDIVDLTGKRIVKSGPILLIR